MDEQSEDDDAASLRECVKELEDNYRNFLSSTASVISGAKSFLEKAKNHKICICKDTNNKLSDCAQKAIEDSKGPLKPEELHFLMNDVLDKKYKNALDIIRKYSNNTDGVQKQISQILDIVEMNIEYRKKQDKLDVRFLKNINKWNEAVAEETHKEKQSKKKQSNIKESFEKAHSNKQTKEVSKDNSQSSSKQVVAKRRNKYSAPSEKLTTYRRNKSSSSDSSENSATQKVAEIDKNRMSAKQCRKRKLNETRERSSSQESGVTEITRRLRKRCKISSPNGDTEKFGCRNTDPMTGAEGCSVQDVEPMSYSEESSSQETDSTSQVSEGTGNEADLSSESSSEDAQKKKTSDSDLKDSLELGKNGETVPPREFCLRGKPFRRNLIVSINHVYQHD